MRVGVSRTGTASAQEAWDRYADLDRWGEWAPQIWRVRAEPRTLVQGLYGRVYAAPGLGVEFVVERVSAERRSWTWIVRPLTVPKALGALAEITMEHRVWAAGSGAGTSLVMHGPAALVSSYAPLAGHALSRLVAR